MTPAAEARHRIARAAETGAAVLDLGDLNLGRLPDEVGRLAGLRVLALGRSRPVADRDAVRWEPEPDRDPVLTDLGPVGALPLLQALDLGGCRLLSDLSPLAGATGLTALNLSGCESLSDLSPLAGLSHLAVLDLSDCRRVADLSPLAGRDGLLTLKLGGTAAENLTPLAGLTSLRELDLRDTPVTDLAPLAGLEYLVRLGLEGCQRVRAFAPLRPLVEELDELLLRGCGCRDLPPELFPAGPGGNAAGAVRGYYRDLAAGDAPGLEVRVFVLGNGGVGKTKLCLRLRDEPYATPTDSTHGVRVHDLALRVPHPTHPVRAHLWDFGGQDVYHGSHALFLGGPAVLLVLWHPDAERDGDRPLPYWLDYAAAVAGRDHVVLVAQARADRPGDDARVADAPGLRAPVLAVSGATDRGLSTLRAAVEQAVGDLLAAEAVRPVGRTWAAVRARLRADRRPFLTRDEFGAVCDECGVAPRDEARDDLLAFFDDTGVVIHRPGVWPDRVILDKEWALGAIYTLLDRVRVLPVLRENGRFTRLDLADLAWQQRAVDEQRLFLAMMQECGICFQIGACDLGAGPEPLYVAPELLPTAAARGVERFAPKEPPAVTATARFRFLHDGVLRSVLAGVGQRFGEDARYWRWGCFIDDGRTGTCARVDAARGGPGDGPGGGTVTVRAWGSGADDLANWLRGHVGRAGKSAGGEEPDWAVVRPAAPADGRQEVAISYAHGDDRDDRGRVRREFVGGLEEAMRGWGYVPRRDVNELANCGLIRDFVKTVGRSGRVVLVLSRKYLRSVYCMSELHAVYQRSLGDAADFADRVVPCVLEDDLGIDGDDGRCDWADHWQREYDRRYGRVKSLGKEDLSLWHDIGQWVRTVGDMLAFVSNIATTWGHEALAAEGYAAVRAMLDRPARGA